MKLKPSLRPAQKLSLSLLLLFLSLVSSSLLLAVPDDLRIVSVNPGTDEVVVLNTATSTTTVATDMAFCYRFNYTPRITAGTTFAAGEAKTFILADLDNGSSDVWLYRGTSGFGNAANIVTGMQYGGPGDIGRTGIARGANLWTGSVAPVPTTYLAVAFTGADAAALPMTGTDWVVQMPTNPVQPPADPSTQLGLLCVADGLSSPLGMRQAADDDRIFIYDQNGKIHILRNGVLEPNLFADLGTLLAFNFSGYDERGLLGFELHPNFPADRRVYTYSSEPASGNADFTVTSSAAHDSVITEWQVGAATPDAVDPATRRIILRVEQPQSNHNGGDIAFGPDGMLYIAFGDGGASKDVGAGHPAEGHGQALSTILGAIARIDPFGNTSANGQYAVPADNPFVGRLGVVPEIYAYGFRNPYRMSFDRLNGDLYTGDVGQNAVEELDLVTAGGNYGWNMKEGSLFYDAGGNTTSTTPFGPVPAGLIDPIAEYPSTGSSVIGGYVVRGGSRPDLEGVYVFGDWRGRIFLYRTATGATEPAIGMPPRSFGLNIKGFGQDATGDVYVMSSDSTRPNGSGKVFRIAPLVEITDIEIDQSNPPDQITLSFNADAANPQVEASPELPMPSWTPVNAVFTPIGGGQFTAEFPAPASNFKLYRIKPTP